ncbi:MAG TPA: HAD family hydrolase [Pseudonocardiaceae bacterium]|nr:HAD family hydrolase [Pseudonocardiaceae bacterium]
MTRVILWDFDGTLATRPGLWSACVIEVLDQYSPDHGVSRSQVARMLESRFPWHDWETAHDHLSDSEAWWDPVLVLITDAMMAVGIPPGDTAAVAGSFRECFLDSNRWHVYDDSLPALRLARREGWRNVILSNHVPELPALVEQLGLADHVEVVISSAAHGYEKPHPEAFRIALEAAEAPTSVWMVGDNPIADIAGAAQLGIPGILARVPDLDPAIVQRLESSYGAARFPDWQQLCDRRAETALKAVELILSDGR